MKTTHTDGEWTVESKSLIKCNGEQIASTNSMIDEYEANAKLIAAAPNLLAACIKALKEIQNPKRDGTLAEEDLTNAIKKATE